MKPFPMGGVPQAGKGNSCQGRPKKAAGTDDQGFRNLFVQRRTNFKFRDSGRQTLYGRNANYG